MVTPKILSLQDIGSSGSHVLVENLDQDFPHGRTHPGVAPNDSDEKDDGVFGDEKRFPCSLVEVPESYEICQSRQSNGHEGETERPDERDEQFQVRNQDGEGD